MALFIFKVSLFCGIPGLIFAQVARRMRRHEEAEEYTSGRIEKTRKNIITKNKKTRKPFGLVIIAIIWIFLALNDVKKLWDHHPLLFPVPFSILERALLQGLFEFKMDNILFEMLHV